MRDFKPAFRALIATPAATLAVIATLAIAIGANTAIFSVVSGVLLRPLGYRDDASLVVLHAQQRGGTDLFRLSPADYRDVRDQVTAFQGQVALYRYIGSTLTALPDPQRVGSLRVTPDLFDVLQAQAVLGTLFDPAGPRGVTTDQAVLTQAGWRGRFGADPAVVGSKIEIDGAPHTIVGVLESGFEFPPARSDVEIYLPMRLTDRILLDRDHRMFESIARLQSGVSPAAARAELEALAGRLEEAYGPTNAGWTLTLRSLRQEIVGDAAPLLWVLSAAVFLILVIACANVANVFLARAPEVGRESAIRAALGATSGQVFARALAESLLLAAAGGTAGVLLALTGVRLLKRVLPRSIPRVENLGVDGEVLAIAAVLTLGTALFFALLTTLPGLRADVTRQLKPSAAGGPSSSGGAARLRQALVAVEVALAVVLLVAAGLMVQSFARLSEVDPGFRREGLVSMAIQLPSTSHGTSSGIDFFQQLVDRVAGRAGVKAVGAVSDLPMGRVALDLELEFEVAGLDSMAPTTRPNAAFRLMIPGYFKTMGIPLQAGRGFDRTDAGKEKPVAIVNQTLVDRYLPQTDPIGRHLRVGLLGEVEIVGVVSDVLHGGPLSPREAEVYIPFGQIFTSEMHVVVHSDLDPDTAIAAIGDVLHEMDPRVAPSETAVISELLWQSVAQPRFNAALLVGLAGCGALLAGIGIYAMVATLVSSRRHEIGVRMALGADSRATLVLVMRQALAVVACGAVAGIFVALGASRVLEAYLFDLEPTDWPTYVAVATLVIVVGLPAAWAPARRATRIDPVVALHR